jgi:hypothetical protein
MSYVLGQIVGNEIYTDKGFQPLPGIGRTIGGIGSLFGARPQMGFDPRMLDSITEPIVRFYGQEKMGPFRQELMGLIKETFPDFVEGGIMGAIQPYGGLSMDQFNMIAEPKGVFTTSGSVGENAFGNSIKSTGLGSVFDMGYK